jgi:hypothetical protein
VNPRELTRRRTLLFVVAGLVAGIGGRRGQRGREMPAAADDDWPATGPQVQHMSMPEDGPMCPGCKAVLEDWLGYPVDEPES